MKTKPFGATFKVKPDRCGYQKSMVDSEQVSFKLGVKIMDGKMKIKMMK